ncbi:MAG: O-antigen ligase family protein [Candidatus Magasanikbacteria bacterium]|nr:O-antigen ligase family protein [Candidatus Magasanikbacteria bacterium]
MSKIIRVLIYLLIFLIPWQTRLILRSGVLNGGNWEYGIVGVYATEILLWLILLFFVLDGGLRNQQFSKKIKTIFLIVLIFSLINFLIAPDKLIFAQQLLHIIEVGILIWLVKKNNLNQLILFWSFIGGLVLQALLGINQFLLQTTFASRWLGLTLHNPSISGSSILENWDGRWLRAYGGMPHPNVLGGYLALGILINIFFLALYLNDKKQRLLALVNLGILTLALFFTFSRSAWLSLFVGLAVLAIGLWRTNKERLIKVFSALVLLILMFSVLSFIYNPLVFGRVTGEGRLEAQSNMERLSGYNEAAQLFKKNIFWGVGLGNYTLAAHNQVDDSKGAWDYQPVHNVLILALVELGVIGFLILFWLIRSFNYKGGWMWLAFLPILFLDHYLWSSWAGWLLICILFLSFIKTKTNP